MKRKKFLKNMTLATLSFSLLESCSKPFSTQTCNETPEGEEGPFPTHSPANYTSQNIIKDRVGTPLKIQIHVKNINDKCEALADARVDIWHCDSKGDYSEYGGESFALPNRINDKEPPHGPPPGSFPDSARHHGPPPEGGGMQKTDYTKNHFLRGRQITNQDGVAAFTSIYPGWYSGRATHVHAHIFDQRGTSLLITQIAFPEEISHQVYKNGVYAKHGLADTSNTDDHVFKGHIAEELGVLSGNLTNGYTLEHTIYVKA